jgi:hypothetical protein
MQAPQLVGHWNRSPNVSNVFVYTCAGEHRPAGFSTYDHISLPTEMGSEKLAGHMHVTVRGFKEAVGSFIPQTQTQNGLFGGMKNGPDFVYKYDFELSYGGISLLQRPYKNTDRAVSTYVGEGQQSRELNGTKVKTFPFVQGDSERGNWQITFNRLNIESVARKFYEDWFAAQAFWVKVEGTTPDDSLELDYAVKDIGSPAETTGKLSASGISCIARPWSTTHFKLTTHDPTWAPPTPGQQCMTPSGRYRYSFSLRKPAV